MTGGYIQTQDLAAFASIPEVKAAAMIADAEAKACLVAPALGTPDALTDVQKQQVKAILRDAILRWNDRGSGALTQTSIGQVSVSTDTRSSARSLFTGDEVTQLRAIVADHSSAHRAFAIDLGVPAALTVGAREQGWG